jgi:25S rRNA (uracil2843-N3)-methyltransferase
MDRMKDQKLLNLISSTFSKTLFSPVLTERLQSLKTHLFNRSFADAFPTSTSEEDEDQQAMLETYVVRWVPTRALCYTRIFQKIEKFLPSADLRIMCIGAGCGSETLALQAALSNESTTYFDES